MKFPIPLLPVVLSARVFAQDDCVSSNLSAQPPASGTGVVLQSFELCKNGSLFASAFVENINYNKIVRLTYADPLSANNSMSFSFNGFVSSTNQAWETWTASGIVPSQVYTRLLNLTYQATDVGRSFMQQLDQVLPYAAPTGVANDVTTYLAASNNSEAGLSGQLLFKNIDIPGAANGTVIAAQSYENPNYAYNWVRDASLVFDVVEQLYAHANDSSAKADYEQLLFAYANARAVEQNDPKLATGLGEPKFNLNNTVFTGPWGRPQNDGPATSAITLMNFANAYLASGGSSEIVKSLVWGSGQANNTAPVLRDLLFVASNWSSPSFDIWEEVESQHFYNRMVSHRALKLGMAFAVSMNDSTSSAMLSTQANVITANMSQFWDADRGQINYEIGPVLRNKTSYSDIAVVLGVLHGYAGDGLYSYADEQVLASAYQIVTSFLPIYGIASTTMDSSDALLGIPVGRYPEDTYNGTATANTAGGNPWFLSTTSIAELFYNTVSELRTNGSLTVTATSAKFWTYFAPQANLSSTPTATFAADSPQISAATEALLGWADAQMRRAKYHIGPSGHIAEEFDRTTGLQVGAADLSWSYAALLTAAAARAKVMGDSNWLVSLANIGF